MTALKRLGAYLNGLPDMEALFPLLEVLHKRGEVQPVLFATTALLRRDSRIRARLQASGIPFSVWPNRILKMASWPFFDRFDLHIGLTDPASDTSGHAARLKRISARGIPHIYVQHGVVQRGLTYVDDQTPDWASDLVLLFEEANPGIFADHIGRTRATGFLRPALFGPAPLSDAGAKAVKSYAKTVLFCHSFRWENRFSQEKIEAFYEMVAGFAASSPDQLAVIRAHRGKKRGEVAKIEDELEQAHPNILFSRQYSGAFKGLSMTDMLAISDSLISTPSTALLDGLYMEKPTAVFANDTEEFAALPQIEGLSNLSEFLSNPARFQPKFDTVCQRYGVIEANLRAAADAIETFAATR